MGSAEEKPGFMSSNWVTIVLVAVLLIFAAILIIILKTGGFDRFKKNRTRNRNSNPARCISFINLKVRPRWNGLAIN